jgi:hypothetical protein
VRYRDLPEPISFRRMIGPGVIASGVGLASGEFIIWPYISTQVGLVFLWAAFVGVLTQFFINMEIERYTLATGETALTGFNRMWRHWGLFFTIGAIAANMWPGWATSAAVVTTYATGGGNVTVISVVYLLIIGVLLTASPVVYQTVEKTQFFKVSAVVVLIVTAAVAAISGDDYADLGASFANFGHFPSVLPVSVLMSALAFAGAGGAQNLVQSNWMRDKGYGMGAYMPRLVSPITGQVEAAPGTGFIFETTPENMRRWRQWWKLANLEQLLAFALIATLTITATSLLAYATVFGRDDLKSNITFIQAEGKVLQQAVGPWFGSFFWIIGAISLFAAALGILDYVGRLVADVVRVNYARGSERWTENRIYGLVVWGLISFGIVTILVGFSQPLVLLVISAVIGGFMMFVYSGLLAYTNTRYLPEEIRIGKGRFAVLMWAILLFGVLSVITFITEGSKLF